MWTSWNNATGQELLSLRECKPRTFNVRCVMGFEQQRPRTHRGQPLFGELRGIKKAAGALDACERCCDRIRYGEAWREAHDILATIVPEEGRTGELRLLLAVYLLGFWAVRKEMCCWYMEHVFCRR